jgi:hypothetical protein
VPLAPAGRARSYRVRAARLLAAILLVLAAPVMAAAMDVQVEIIYATNAESGIDQSIIAYAQSLQALRYSGYRRIGGQTLRVAGEAAASMDLPGGRRLDLMPKGVDGMKVVVSEGGRKIVGSEVRLVPGGQPVIMGGFKYKDGALFLAIQAMR